MDTVDHMFARAAKAEIPPELVRQHVGGIFEAELHSKRVLSLGNGVIGVVNATSLSIPGAGAPTGAPRPRVLWG